MKRRLFATILVPIMIIGATTVTSAASAPNPYAQMKAVLAHANADQTFRDTITLTMGTKKLVNVTDATHIGGRQTITLTAAGKSNSVIVELIAGNVYVKGNAAILVSYMGFPKATAKRLANHWLEFGKSTSGFAQLSAGLTIASVLSQTTMTQSVKSSAAVSLRGEMVDVLKGTLVKTAQSPAAAETLYFSTGSRPLPVEITQLYQGSLATVVFDHWDETVVLVTPKTVLEQQ